MTRFVGFLNRKGPLICVGLLICTVIGCMAFYSIGGSGEKGNGSPEATGKYIEEEQESVEGSSVLWSGEEEIRAVWVPFMTLDMSKEADQSEGAFREKFSTIIKGALDYNMNALIVHVHPFGDALYTSEYYPWSHILTGTQGKDPGYDPLKIMVEMAHEAGLELHAWMNPLRIQVNTTPETLSEDNPAVQWEKDEEKSKWIVRREDGIFYNPAYEGVRQYVAEGAAEIADNYDVDGIHFDDYFYPTEDESFDAEEYTAYKEAVSDSGTPLSLQEWRCANINALVSLVYQKIKEAAPSVLFGIAPQGNIANDLNMGADVAVWCKAKGYVDYICPQLYVNFENKALPFENAAREWEQLVTCEDVKLCLGLAVYKAGSDDDDGTWKHSSDILARQVSLGRELKCSGFMFYSWEYLSSEQTKEEVQNVMKILD